MGNKTPGKSSGTVDVRTPARQPGGAPPLRPDSPPRVHVDLPALPATGFAGAPRLPDTARPQVAAPTVEVGDVAAVPAAPSVPRPRPLRYYRIPAGIHLPDVDAQGFRLFQGRQFAQVQDGFVQVGLDPETGLLRARLASETTPSGPVLIRTADSHLWRPLEESDSNVYRSAAEEGTDTRHPKEREMESDHSDDEYFLASESMPFIPYSPHELMFMRQVSSHRFRDNQLGTYNRANNGRYPLRDMQGRPIRIRKIESTVKSYSGKIYKASAIKPYIKFEGYDEVGRLYEDKIEVRHFSEVDAKVPQERAMIGQLMVAANRRLTKGEPLGVYGGTVMPLRLIRREEQTFTMYVGEAMRFGGGQLIADPLVIVGDNAMSRINSNFEYDAKGKPVHQARSGYNVETVAFNVEAQLLIGEAPVTRSYVLTALFASEDIPAGTELRMDYDYSDKEMGWVFP
ncbi:hypothetical protein [Pseudomonas sp. PB106]|uniref:hypothetical protein n=1 Tax=Pseudomonas sp. PB106 TaxID=2494699 RepID=UPI00131AD2A4|nr:hypothetical protein [Pseudomonas sp. PB106]KAE9642773.1 hypothetical protein EJA71_18640 [Pseudomonas sp. PB106]